MTILKLSNSFYTVATQLGLNYHCGLASDVERNVINTQGALLQNPNGQTGNLYPKCNLVYPDAVITDFNEFRITYKVLLLFTDLLNVDNTGMSVTDLHTETLSKLNEKAIQFVDVVQNQLAPFLTQKGDIFSINNVNLESLTYATKDKTAMIKCTFDVESYYECNTFQFDPSQLEVDTPFPVDGDYDYEDTNNK